MSFIGKLYTLQRDENFDALLKSFGLPDDKIKIMLADKSCTKIDKKGDGYVMTNTSTNGSKDVDFKSGVVFDDVVGPQNTPIKATITVNGDEVVQVMKSDRGTVTIKREFKGDDLLVTITSDKFDGVAKRYYKA